MSRSVPYSANPLLRIKLPAYRSRLLLLLMAFAFIALIGRAAYLQLFTHGFLQKQGESRYGRTIELPASRGKVLDRNGVVLASSLPARAVWASPEEVKATPEQLASLAKLLEMPPAELARRLEVKGKTFVYLKRQVEAEAAARVHALAIPGVHQRKEYKRFYPEGEALAHVVGFTNVEDIGQEGIELARERELAGKPGSRRVLKDNFNRVIEDVGTLREPLEGHDLQLSIDSKIQFHAFSALREALREHRAKAGAAVVLDVQTGEVLALANLPTYNPNQRGQLSGAQLRNRVITDTFEPGSTMKPFTSALALESGRFTPQSVIQTAPGRLTIGSATIGDAHTYGALTVEQVLQKSSNVGTAKIALSFPPEKMWNMFTAVGFGQAPDLGFPGAVAGRVRPHKSWRPIEQATMSYGHGISVSLIQMARAYTVFARDGDLVPLSMVRTGAPAVGVKVIEPRTAQAVRRMLEMAAGPGGTAPKAQIVGYRVAGKTGTAHKQEGGRYINKYIASFVGFAPASNPRIVIAVMIDEPSAGRHYGGDVAAPVFAQIAGDSLRALRIARDAPLANLVIPAEPVKESM
ncbi:MAG: penicillin-binding protein 2 [Burkholderiaceae bacterium]|nr:penicillin-binding protein 2 [Burkholderiaceae bacterium]